MISYNVNTNERNVSIKICKYNNETMVMWYIMTKRELKRSIPVSLQHSFEAHAWYLYLRLAYFCDDKLLHPFKLVWLNV